MRTLAAAGLVLLFTALVAACPLHGAEEHGHASSPAQADGSFCAALHASTCVQPVILPSTWLLATGTGITPEIGVLPSWLLVLSIEHPPR